MVSLEEFLEGLKASRLMTAAEVHALLVSLPPDMQPPSLKQLAAELVRRGKLTRFQAGRIAVGRPRGLVLGKYVIQDKIGEGGMGEVFIAEHRRMKRPVVVKILPPAATESEQSIRRFQREVEAAAQLQHPNVVTAFDADEEDGIHFLVMEYVDGSPLGELVAREGPMSLEKAVHCALQAARGLEYAHSKGIVHRDIKPNNLMLVGGNVVKILDMGLARFDDGRATLPAEKHGDGLTQQNQIVGTVEYMSPEQVDDSSAVDGRSDIYSLGCTLFRLLTDHPPYQCDSVVKTLLAHRADPIPSILDERPDAPPLLDRILKKMMAKSPADRYPTATELIKDLQFCLKEVRSRAPSPAPLPRLGERPGDSETTVIDPAAQAKLLRARQRGNEGTVEIRTGEETRTQDAAEVLRQIATFDVPAVGIDLGTTFSAIAVLDGNGRPQVLANQEGDTTTPSVVLLDGDEVIVGKEAVKAMSTDMECIAECAKRELGFRSFHAKLAGRDYPPEVIQAWILNKLRRDAQQVLGRFEKVVITVPAYFDEVRRKATQDAGYLAGLDVLDIINEPTAAALAFGFQQGNLELNSETEPKRVLVYDLGGGTFDVTVMEIAGGEFFTMATDGDVQLGGRDWDQRLVDHVAEIYIRKHHVDPREDPNTFGRLLRDCEEAKRTLSSRRRAAIECYYRGHSERVEVTREQLEEMTLDLLERTSFTTRQTLQAAGLEWSDIDHILLVGGSTRMPAVARLLERISGRQPETSLSADEAVAQGAALHAGLLLERMAGREPRVRVRNVNSHSLGVVATDRRTTRRQSAVLIPRNTPLPAKAKRVFKTLRAGQRSIVATIVEGESNDPSDCIQIGRCTVRDLPDLPAGTPIEVRFRYEANGRLQVSVNVAGHDQNVTQEIRRQNNLSEAELKKWRERIAG